MDFNTEAASGAAGIGAGQNPVVLNDGRAGAQAEVVYIFPIITACLSCAFLLGVGVMAVATSSFLNFAAMIAALGLVCVLSKFVQVSPTPSQTKGTIPMIIAIAILGVVTISAIVAWPALQATFFLSFATFIFGLVGMVEEIKLYFDQNNKTIAITLSIEALAKFSIMTRNMNV